MAGGEDGDDAVPVVGFELLGGVDEDEAEGAVGVDGGEEAGEVQDVGVGGGGVWGGVEAVGEEGFDVREAEEGGGGGGEEDDGVRAAVVFGVGAGGDGGVVDDGGFPWERDEGRVGIGGEGFGGAGAGEKRFGDFADVGEILGYV